MISNEEPDIIISCGDYNHRVPQTIISVQSQVLAAMCDGNFLEGKTGKINLPDDDPEAVNIMIQHLYRRSYRDTRPNLEELSGDDRALMDLNVYTIANKYIIQSLEECAKEEFRAWAMASQRTEFWGRIVNEIWKGEEFSGLHLIIEKQVADDIDRMLEDDWLSFLDKG
ncbi:hypothetical protein DPV78_000266 [Talaromyces pinophilus]|nr:hypothetical protein DPV78_000266 [Talaromyces pinophilus]